MSDTPATPPTTTILFNGKALTPEQIAAELQTLQTKLADAEARAQAADDLKNTANTFFKAEGEDFIKTTRAMLGKLGWSASDIDAFVKSRFEPPSNNNPDNNPNDNSDDNSEGKSKSSKEPAVDSQTLEEIEALRKQQQQLQRQLALERLNNARARIIGPDSPLGKLLNEVEKAKGAEVANALRKTISQNFERDLTESIRTKVASGTEFSLQLIDEEATATAKSLQSTFAPVIGDPGFLGKTPETTGTSDILTALAGKKPVEAPTFKPGKSVADMAGELREFAKDQLMRGAVEDGLAASGETKA